MGYPSDSPKKKPLNVARSHCSCHSKRSTTHLRQETRVVIDRTGRKPGERAILPTCRGQRTNCWMLQCRDSGHRYITVVVTGTARFPVVSQPRSKKTSTAAAGNRNRMLSGVFYHKSFTKVPLGCRKINCIRFYYDDRKSERQLHRITASVLLNFPLPFVGVQYVLAACRQKVY